MVLNSAIPATQKSRHSERSSSTSEFWNSNRIEAQSQNGPQAFKVCFGGDVTKMSPVMKLFIVTQNAPNANRCRDGYDDGIGTYSASLRYWFDFRCGCRLKLCGRSFLIGPKNIPCLNNDTRTRQLVNPPIIVGLLGMKQRLHRINYLIFSVPFSTSPCSDKIFGFISIMLRKIIN